METNEIKNKPTFIHGVGLSNDAFIKVQQWNKNQKPECIISRPEKTKDGEKTGKYNQVKISAVDLQTIRQDLPNLLKALQAI